MKKILSLVIAFALVLSAICTLVVSAEGEAITVAADKNEIDPGDTVIVTVTLDNAQVKAIGIKIDVPEGFEVLVDNFAINDDVTEFKPEGSNKKVKPIMAQDMEDNGDGTYAPAVVTYDETQVLSGDLLAIEVLASTEIAAGKYNLTVTVSNEGEDPVEFPIEITINGDVEESSEPVEESSEPVEESSEPVEESSEPVEESSEPVEESSEPVEPTLGVVITQYEDLSGISADVDYAFNLEAVDTDPGEYAECEVDFILTFNQDLDNSKVSIYGNYGDYGWLGGALSDAAIEVKANEGFKVIESFLSTVGFTGPVTYADVVNVIKSFDCGVKVEDAPNGLVATLDLVIYLPQEPEIVDTITVEWNNEEESSEPVEESSEPEPDESEESVPVVPPTGDAGLIALAFATVIALGATVIVKKSK
ncbi:MAG: hypothetical protein IJL41_04750 [Clostridia bacterium]|nr:hypothetical protein [Clostridia bacterium]